MNRRSSALGLNAPRKTIAGERHHLGVEVLEIGVGGKLDMPRQGLNLPQPPLARGGREQQGSCAAQRAVADRLHRQVFGQQPMVRALVWRM